MNVFEKEKKSMDIDYHHLKKDKKPHNKQYILKKIILPFSISHSPFPL